MNLAQLNHTALELVSEGRGILAADESTGTMTRRLEALGVESTEEVRRAWRQLLFTTEGIGDQISGVILYDETIRQKADDGRMLTQALTDAGVIPGIKVDRSTHPLAGAPGEVVTEGLDGLRARLAEYHDMGARFAKWRAVIAIGNGIPSDYCIGVNAHALARYAALAQEADLVPIVEPEVLMDGDHDIDACFSATERALRRTFQALDAQGVALEGILLKPNMVLSGAGAPDRADADKVAEATIRCFKRAVPAAVPGIVFLSGGQGDEEATVNLDAINRRAAIEGAPWELSFSYGRGLQATPLKVWGGSPGNVADAQDAFRERARLTAAARRAGHWPVVST